jgi:hypothetical protein
LVSVINIVLIKNTVMFIINKILYIPEIEAIIFSNLDLVVDFKALVNHYYYQIINQNKLYT